MFIFLLSSLQGLATNGIYNLFLFSLSQYPFNGGGKKCIPYIFKLSSTKILKIASKHSLGVPIWGGDHKCPQATTTTYITLHAPYTFTLFNNFFFYNGLITPSLGIPIW